MFCRALARYRSANFVPAAGAVKVCISHVLTAAPKIYACTPGQKVAARNCHAKNLRWHFCIDWLLNWPGGRLAYLCRHGFHLQEPLKLLLVYGDMKFYAAAIHWHKVEHV